MNEYQNIHLTHAHITMNYEIDMNRGDTIKVCSANPNTSKAPDASQVDASKEGDAMKLLQ